MSKAPMFVRISAFRLQLLTQYEGTARKQNFLCDHQNHRHCGKQAVHSYSATTKIKKSHYLLVKSYKYKHIYSLRMRL